MHKERLLILDYSQDHSDSTIIESWLPGEAAITSFVQAENLYS